MEGARYIYDWHAFIQNNIHWEREREIPIASKYTFALIIIQQKTEPMQKHINKKRKTKKMDNINGNFSTEKAKKTWNIKTELYPTHRHMLLSLCTEQKKSTTWETRNVKLIQWKTLYIRWAKCINTYLLGGKQNAIMYSSQSPNIIIGRFICGRLQLGKY